MEASSNTQWLLDPVGQQCMRLRLRGEGWRAGLTKSNQHNFKVAQTYPSLESPLWSIPILAPISASQRLQMFANTDQGVNAYPKIAVFPWEINVSVCGGSCQKWIVTNPWEAGEGIRQNHVSVNISILNKPDL